MKTMTSKARMVGLIHGEEINRVPFVQYHNLNAKDEDIWKVLDRDSMGILGWVPAYRIETPNCQIQHEEIHKGELDGWRDILITPKGTLTQQRFLVPELNGSTGFTEHYIKTIDDYHILLAYLRDFKIVEDLTYIQQFNRQIGDKGISHVVLPRTPYQALWIKWVSIENLILHMQDEPELLEEVMNLLGDILIRALKTTAGAVGKTEFYHVTVGDNIHASIIGKKLFQKWCIPYYDKISDTLMEEEILCFVHMDGDLKPIWEDIDSCHFQGFDSLSPPPDNDTRVGEALSRWPDKTVWANFPSSVHLQKADKIYQKALELFGRRWSHTTFLDPGF